MEKITDSFDFNDSFSGNMAVFCSDERFAGATLSFLENIFGNNRFDLVSVPGGPAFISKDEPVLMKHIELLIEEHKILNVILISHEDCGYYKKNYKSMPEKEKLNQQHL